jgi:choline kinase
MPRATTAVILLAGMGTRLRPLTETQHKALIKIGDKTILERQLEQLARHGIQHVHLVLGYRAEDIKAFVASNAPDSLTVTCHHNKDFEKNNTGASLALVLPHLDAPFLLLDGDVVLDDALITPLIQDTPDSRFLCDTDTAKLNLEAVRILADHQNAICDISKHVPLPQSAGESIGVSLYQADWITPLQETLAIGLADRANWKWYYEDALHVILTAGVKLSALRVIPTGNQKWVEIDDHADLARARELFS